MAAKGVFFVLRTFFQSNNLEMDSARLYPVTNDKK